MRFSQKTEYGLRAVLFLAARYGQAGLPARDIAREERIPERFLEQQVTRLARAGIVTSQRGPSGGCKLARHPSDVSVLEVVEALEGPLVAPSGGRPSPAETDSASQQVVQELFAEMGEAVAGRLAEISVSELLARRDGLASARGGMFYI